VQSAEKMFELFWNSVAIWHKLCMSVEGVRESQTKTLEPLSRSGW
jgi:hypothetical protein